MKNSSCRSADVSFFCKIAEFVRYGKLETVDSGRGTSPHVHMPYDLLQSVKFLI